MKKYIYNLFALAVITLGCLSLTACGGDDDGGGGSTGGNGGGYSAPSLVGTWTTTWDDGNVTVRETGTFNSDYTGVWKVEESDGDVSTAYFTWVLSDNKVYLNWTGGDYYNDSMREATIVSLSQNTLVANTGKGTFTLTRVSGGSDDSGNTGDDDDNSGAGNQTTTSALVGAYTYTYTPSYSSQSVVETMVLNSDNTGSWTLYTHKGDIDNTGTFNWKQDDNKINLTWTSYVGDAVTEITIVSQNANTLIVNDTHRNMTLTKVSDGSSSSETTLQNFVGKWLLNSFMEQDYVNGVASGSLYAGMSEDNLIVTEDGVIRYYEKGSSGYHYDGISTFAVKNGNIELVDSWMTSFKINALSYSELDVEWTQGADNNASKYSWYRSYCYKIK